MMLLRYAILGLLDGQELHGYRLKSMFEERMGLCWSLNFGQIYSTLKDLKRRGLVTGRFDQGERHVGRWVYTITSKGRRALATWLQRSPGRPPQVRDEILIRLLAVDGKPGEPALAQLASQERIYRAYMVRLSEERRALARDAVDGSVLKALAVDAALSQADAHLKWLARCAVLLRARDLGRFEGVEPMTEAYDRVPSAVSPHP